jgi:hypothetical protein
MFTAALILCSMTNVTNCQGMGSQSIYTSLEACEAQKVQAEDYFYQRGIVVMDYKCISWGKPV